MSVGPRKKKDLVSGAHLALEAAVEFFCLDLVSEADNLSRDLVTSPPHLIFALRPTILTSVSFELIYRASAFSFRTDD